MSAARLSPVRCAASSSTCLADSLSLIRVCRRMPDCCADQTLGKVLGVCVVDSFREQDRMHSIDTHHTELDTMRYAHFTTDTEARAFCAECQAAGRRAYVLGMRADFWEVRVF